MIMVNAEPKWHSNTLHYGIMDKSFQVNDQVDTMISTLFQHPQK